MADIKKKQDSEAKVKDSKSNKKDVKKTKKPRKSPIAFVKEVIAELKKVTWPTRKEIGSYSLVVVVFITVMAVVLFALDSVFGRLLDLILSL
ncbi:MAG: preprotein translocase subunit SecE [Christensenellales bacterium]|jgi:preprotein translocase subunit SecE